MWLPLWRRKMNPARSRAARAARPERSVGSLSTWRRRQRLSLRSLDFDEFFACFGGDRIPSVAAVLHVKPNGFTDIVQRFSAGVSLADTSGQRRHARDVSAIFFLFQNDRVTH